MGVSCAPSWRGLHGQNMSRARGGGGRGKKGNGRAIFKTVGSAGVGHTGRWNEDHRSTDEAGEAKKSAKGVGKPGFTLWKSDTARDGILYYSELESKTAANALGARDINESIRKNRKDGKGAGVLQYS